MYANDATMPQADVTSRKPKKKHRVAEAAAVAAGAGTAYAGFRTGQAMKKVGAAADAAKDSAATVNKAVSKGRGFLKGAKRQLTTFPTFKKIVKRLLSSGREPDVELGLFHKKGSVAQDKYRKGIDERDHAGAEKGYTRAAIGGTAVGALLHKGGTRKGVGKAAAAGAAAGLVTQAVVRRATSGTKDEYGERTRTGKIIDKAPGTAATVVAGGLLLKKAAKGKGKGGGAVKRGLRRFLNARLKNAVELAGVADVAARVEKSAGSRVGDWLKKRWAGASKGQRAAVVGAGALGGAGAVTGAVAPEKGDTRSGSAVSHGVKDAVFGGTLYGVTEPFLKKTTGADAEGVLKAAKKIKKALGSKLGARLIELRAAHHSDAEGRDHGGKFKDSLKSYVEKDKNYKGDTVGITDKPVLKSALRKAQTVRRIGSRAGGLAKDAVDHVRGVKKVDERGRPKKREWEKTWFKNGVQNAAIAGAGLGVAAHLKNHPGHYKEVQAIKRGVTGQKTTGKRNPTTGKMTYKKVTAPKSKIGKGIVKASDKVKGGVGKIARKLFSAGMHRRLIQLDYYDRHDWDLRDPRGKSARVFAPGSKTRVRRPKKFHEKASTQRKIAVAATVAGTAVGALIGGKKGYKRGVKAAEAKFKRAAPNKGKKLIKSPDGSFYHKPGSK